MTAGKVHSWLSTCIPKHEEYTTPSLQYTPAGGEHLELKQHGTAPQPFCTDATTWLRAAAGHVKYRD